MVKCMQQFLGSAWGDSCCYFVTTWKPFPQNCVSFLICWSGIPASLLFWHVYIFVRLRAHIPWSSLHHTTSITVFKNFVFCENNYVRHVPVFFFFSLVWWNVLFKNSSFFAIETKWCGTNITKPRGLPLSVSDRNTKLINYFNCILGARNCCTSDIPSPLSDQDKCLK